MSAAILTEVPPGPMPFIEDARLPDGLRVYAIGDVHGRDDCLQAVHVAIAAELEAAPPARAVVLHVGDYVDRGPASAGVVERLVTWSLSAERIALKGNHEQQMLAFLDDPLTSAQTWLTFGGLDTLRSYGVDVLAVRTGDGAPAAEDLGDGRISLGAEGLHALRDALAAVLPPDHLTFLRGLDLTARFGDYFFCHAGIRPGVPLAAQEEHDLVWIREPFLASARDHGAVIVHGHTPNRSGPDVLPNRINLDTMCFATGRLTCLVLEGASRRFL